MFIRIRWQILILVLAIVHSTPARAAALAEKLIQNLNIPKSVDMFAPGRNSIASCELIAEPKMPDTNQDEQIRKLNISWKRWQQLRNEFKKIAGCHRYFRADQYASGDSNIRTGALAIRKIDEISKDTQKILDNTITSMQKAGTSVIDLMNKIKLHTGNQCQALRDNQEVTQGANTYTQALLIDIKLFRQRIKFEKNKLNALGLNKNNVKETASIYYRITHNYDIKSLPASCLREYRKAYEGWVSVTDDLVAVYDSVDKEYSTPLFEKIDAMSWNSGCMAQQGICNSSP